MFELFVSLLNLSGLLFLGEKSSKCYKNIHTRYIAGLKIISQDSLVDNPIKVLAPNGGV